MHPTVQFVLVLLGAGVAIQQCLEILDACFCWGASTAHKKLVLKVAALLLGSLAVYTAPLPPFNPVRSSSWWIYGVGTLLTAAAAEAANSVLKFLVYGKEARKAAAAQSAGAAGTLNLHEIGKK